MDDNAATKVLIGVARQSNEGIERSTVSKSLDYRQASDSDWWKIHTIIYWNFLHGNGEEQGEPRSDPTEACQQATR